MQDDDRQTADRPPDGRSAEDAPQALGERLRRAREARELSIEQVAAELRMEPQLLTALEEERYEALGAAVFVKGYLKHYGQRLGLDCAELLAAYKETAGQQEMPIIHRPGTEWREERRGSRWLIVLLATLIAVSAYMLWTNGALEGDVARVDDQSSQPATAPGAQPAAPRPAVSAPQVTGANAQAAMPAFDPAPEAAGDDPEIDAATDAADPLQAEVAMADEDTAPESTPSLPAGHAAVTITVREDCWVELTDGEGSRIYFGIAPADAVLRLDGRLPLSFVLGNAVAVELQIDGQPYAIPADSVTGNVARFSVTTVSGSD